MAAPTLAWGEANLYRLPDGNHTWGREFELLPPNGTMLRPDAILQGLIGIEAEPLDERCCQIRDGAPVSIYGVGRTEADDLVPYREDVINGFRVLQTADAQG